MLRHPASIFATVLASLSVAAAASGQTYVGTLSVESNSDQSDPGNGIHTYLNQISVATLDDFDFAFSSLGDVDFSVTWQAPTGYRIKVTPPSGFDATQVLFQFYTGLSGYNVGQIMPSPTLSVTDLLGSTLPTLGASTQFTGPATSTLPANNAGAFVFATGYALDEPFYLSSAKVTFTVPAAYDVDYNAPLLGFNVFGSAYANNPSSPPADPGQWIELVPIPSPGPASAAAIAGLAAMGRRRRA